MGKWTKFMPDGKGGYDVFDNWSLSSEFLYRSGGNILSIILVGILFSILIGPICMFIFPLCSNKERLEYSVGCIVTSALFLIDYFFGWILWYAFINSENENVIRWFEFLATLHLSLIVIWIIILFNFKQIINFLPEITPNVLFWGIVFGIVYFVTYPLFDGMIYGNYSEDIIRFLKPILKS